MDICFFSYLTKTIKKIPEQETSQKTFSCRFMCMCMCVCVFVRVSLLVSSAYFLLRRYTCWWKATDRMSYIKQKSIERQRKDIREQCHIQISSLVPSNGYQWETRGKRAYLAWSVRSLKLAWWRRTAGKKTKEFRQLERIEKTHRSSQWHVLSKYRYRNR